MADNDILVVCSECKSDQPLSYIERSPFGDQAPCKYCGGVLITVMARWREDALRQIDAQRNLGHDPEE